MCANVIFGLHVAYNSHTIESQTNNTHDKGDTKMTREERRQNIRNMNMKVYELTIYYGSIMQIMLGKTLEEQKQWDEERYAVLDVIREMTEG